MRIRFFTRLPVWTHLRARWRFVTPVLAVLALIFTAFAAPARSQASDVGEQSEISADHMTWWWSYANQVWSRRGSHMLSTPAPFVGRLSITSSTGETQICNATLVGAQHVITAAHCVCFDAPNQAACAPRLAGVRTLFMLPAAGSFASVGEPLVHPRYHRPSTAAAGELADLAIVLLDRAPAGVAPAVLSAQVFSPALQHAQVSFGPFSLTASVTYPDGAQQPLFQAGAQYLAGLGMTSVLGDNRLRSGAPCEIPTGSGANAPRISALNVFCARYSDIADAPGSGEQDFIACKGDSGAALIERTPEGASRLVGVASFVSHTAGGCQAGARSGASYYVDVSGYGSWIQEAVGEQVAAAQDRLCVEVLRPGGTYVTAFPHAELRFVSVAVSTLSGDDAAYPNFAIDGPNRGACEMHAEHGFGACPLNGGPVTVTAPAGAKMQITYCYDQP